MSNHESERVLGKIDFADYGLYPERPFLFGLQLGFKMQGCGIFDGGKYTVNISDKCQWREDIDRLKAITMSVDKINNILKDAGVNYVSELVGIPVEITIENNTFKDFRILTEVL